MPTEPTTTRKPATQPLTPPPDLLAPAAAPRARLPGWWRWAMLSAGLLVAAGVALLLVRANDPRADTRPLEVVKGFAAAIEAKSADQMLSFVEPTIARREISPELRAYVEYLREVRFDNPRYELLDNNGERAHVRWTASMHYVLDMGDEQKTGDRPIDTTFELVKFEGTWYLRSAKLPQ